MKKEIILCKCGCSQELNKYDERGRSRAYCHGHNGKKKLEDCTLVKMKNGYVTRGRVYEHRLIMEKYIGRKLKRNEQVHHINGSRADNRIENLKLYNSNSEHHYYHSIERMMSKKMRIQKNDARGHYLTGKNTETLRMYKTKLMQLEKELGRKVLPEEFSEKYNVFIGRVRHFFRLIDYNEYECFKRELSILT